MSEKEIQEIITRISDLANNQSHIERMLVVGIGFFLTCFSVIAGAGKWIFSQIKKNLDEWKANMIEQYGKEREREGEAIKDLYEKTNSLKSEFDELKGEHKVFTRDGKHDR